MKTIHHVRKMVDVEIVNTTMMDDEEIAKRDAKQEEIKNKLTNYANHVYGKCLVKNNIGG